MHALAAEFQGLFIAMQHAWSRSFTKVIFEGDCKKMIDIMNKYILHFEVYNWVREIRWWMQKFEGAEFNWTNRKENTVADKLAKMHIPNDQDFHFHCYVPLHVSHLHLDFVQSVQS